MYSRYCLYMGWSIWYFFMRFWITCSGRFFSLEKGPPGAKRIRKKLSVTMTNIVGIRLRNLRMMNLVIVSSISNGGARAKRAEAAAEPRARPPDRTISCRCT